MEQNNSSYEHKFRLNIKQNSKLERYWNITARADTLEELRINIQKVKILAMNECNQPIPEEDKPKLIKE